MSSASDLLLHRAMRSARCARLPFHRRVRSLRSLPTRRERSRAVHPRSHPFTRVFAAGPTASAGDTARWDKERPRDSTVVTAGPVDRCPVEFSLAADRRVMHERGTWVRGGGRRP